MSNFFPISRGDFFYIVIILIFAFAAFLPWSHRIYLGGMALFGWLMAALMVLSPSIALFRHLSRRHTKNK
jgi:hypothetical protein